MKKIISFIISCFFVLLAYNVYAGIGMNTWDDDKEPWENDSTSFGVDDIFMLIILVISFFISTYIYTVIEEILPEGIKAIHLVIIPGILIYLATCYHSGMLNISAIGSVISAIYYSAVLRRD